jgi:hypothetical protein
MAPHHDQVILPCLGITDYFVYRVARFLDNVITHIGLLGQGLLDLFTDLSDAISCAGVLKG